MMVSRDSGTPAVHRENTHLFLLPLPNILPLSADYLDDDIFFPQFGFTGLGSGQLAFERLERWR